MYYRYLCPHQADPVQMLPSIQFKRYVNVVSTKIQSIDRKS